MKPLLLAAWIAANAGCTNTLIYCDKNVISVEEYNSSGHLVAVYQPYNNEIKINANTALIAFVDRKTKEVVVLQPSYAINYKR